MANASKAPTINVPPFNNQNRLAAEDTENIENIGNETMRRVPWCSSVYPVVSVFSGNKHCASNFLAQSLDQSLRTN
jgi:hypothetical protein